MTDPYATGDSIPPPPAPPPPTQAPPGAPAFDADATQWNGRPRWDGAPPLPLQQWTGQPAVPAAQPAPPAPGSTQRAALGGTKARVSGAAISGLVILVVVQLIRVRRQSQDDSGDGIGALGIAITVVATLAVIGVIAAFVLRKTRRRSAEVEAYLRGLGLPFLMDAYVNPTIFPALGAWGGGSVKRAQAVNCKLATDGRLLHVVSIRIGRQKKRAQPVVIDISGVTGSSSGTLLVARSRYPALVMRLPPTPQAPQGLLLFIARRKWEGSGIETSPLGRLVDMSQPG